MQLRQTAAVGREHRSLRDAVLDELRELIVDGALPPGTRLVERDLADRLEVSRIPLREAIQQLEAEGLAVRLPRRGSTVATLTRADVVELFDVRESLEALAAGLAAERGDPTALTGLSRSLTQAAAATKRHQTNLIAKLNVAFHHEIVTAADNALLLTIMTPLHSRMRVLFRLLTADGAMAPTDLCAEHAALYEAIAGGHRARAERLAREHVARTREPTLAVLAAAGDPLPIKLTPRSHR